MWWMWSRSGAIGLRRRASRRTVTVKTSISTMPSTHSMTGGGTDTPVRWVSATVNQATAKPSTMLPASPMKVR